MNENENGEKLVAIRKGDGNERFVVGSKKKRQFSPLVIAVRKTAVWVAIVSSSILALVAVLAIWTEIDEVAGRAWATFMVIGLASLFIAMIAPLLDQVEQ